MRFWFGSGKEMERETQPRIDPAVWWLILERVENPHDSHDKIVLIAEHRYTGERKFVTVLP